MPTPTVRRLQLGKELARLRGRANLRVEDAAKVLEKSAPVISRLERGETGLRRIELKALVEHYAQRISDDNVDVDWFLDFNKNAENRGRWSGYRSAYPKYLRMAIDLERDAEAIDAYMVEMLYGLFQTEAYMRAMFTSARARTADQHTDDLVNARLERQQILNRDDAPKITVVLSESALLRQIGTPNIMREQLKHLADLAGRPNIQIHVLPFRCATAPSSENLFIKYRIPALDRNIPSLEFVFVETFINGEYLDGNQELTEYNHLWAALLGAALGPVESQNFILRIANNHWSAP